MQKRRQHVSSCRPARKRPGSTGLKTAGIRSLWRRRTEGDVRLMSQKTDATGMRQTPTSCPPFPRRQKRKSRRMPCNTCHTGIRRCGTTVGVKPPGRQAVLPQHRFLAVETQARRPAVLRTMRMAAAGRRPAVLGRAGRAGDLWRGRPDPGGSRFIRPPPHSGA